MLQNATLLTKSAPGPPNSSDEEAASCIAPATENAFLQILFKCPMLAIVFGNATKPSRSAHFWQGPLRLPRKTTSKPPKVARTCGVLYIFDFQVCFGPQRRALFRHLNFQKWSERQVFLVFSLANVLRASSRHNGVHFFDISTSKSDPRMVCFVHSSRHNGVQLFISHLARWLRTRRFSEPTFRPSGATNHWKNTVFCDFPTFSRICIFFLLTLSLLWSPLFTLLFSLTLPISAFHLSILSEVWLLNFLRSYLSLYIPVVPHKAVAEVSKIGNL